MCWAAALSFSVRRVHAGAGPCARHGWHVVRQVGTLHVALKHRQATHPAVGAVRLTDVRLETVGGVSGGCFLNRNCACNRGGPNSDPSHNLGPKPGLNADTPNASCPGPRRCSLCACPLTTDDTMHMTNLFRRECPYDHMVCSTCALSAPHAFHVVGLHACVVCDDPELPPPSSPEPPTFSHGWGTPL